MSVSTDGSSVSKTAQWGDPVSDGPCPEPSTSPVAEDPNAPIDKTVTISAAVLTLLVVAWGLAKPASFSAFAASALDYVVSDWGWLFILAGSVFVGFVLFIAFSRFGHIRLGRDDEQPEFSGVSWVAMMFAAGMGIGLMFYGVTEPLTYFRDSVPGYESGDIPSSMATTLFHWGLHPWALYAIVGLAIAYSTFRLGRRQLLSSAFVPLIGQKRADGWLGKVIDTATIVATIFGTAASLGVGATQISSGLDATELIHDPQTWTLVGIILLLTLAFLASAASGVGKGIQYVSNMNMILAGILALFVLVLGPTVFILNLIPNSLGNYLSEFFEMAARTANGGEDTASFLGSWTIFYWAWWVSWSPFVGMFLARISRGRRVREFLLVVMMVPLAVTIVWFSIFGGTAIEAEQSGRSIWGDGDSTRQLFNLLETLPGDNIASIVAMILLATFFITSADSASTVMGTLSQNGRVEANRWVTVLWGALTALVAIVMLTSGSEDTLSNLQSITIVVASPFVLVVIALMFAIVKAFSEDPLYLDQKMQRELALRVARQRRTRRTAAWETKFRGARAKGRGGAYAAGDGTDATSATAAATATGAGHLEIQEVLASGQGEEIVEVVRVSDLGQIVGQAQAAAEAAEASANAAAAAAVEAEESAAEASEAATEVAGEIAQDDK